MNSILNSIPPVHQEGYRFIAIFAALTIGGFLLAEPLGWIGVILTLWCAWFFRNPERTTPTREGLVISPADGKVSHVMHVTPPPELEMGDRSLTRISIFMNVFDCHINRAPVSGTIAAVQYIPGKFINAELDKASEDNERRLMTIERHDGVRVGAVQIAGLIARRIVPLTDKGDVLRKGDRYGLIRFGSRVDVYLPPGVSSQVAVGQRAVAGETVLADLNSHEPAREAVTG